MTWDQFPQCVQSCEHREDWLHWVIKGYLTEVSEQMLFLAAHSMDVSQINGWYECPQFFAFLAEKTCL